MDDLDMDPSLSLYIYICLVFLIFQALLDAWNKACATPGFSAVTVEAERTLILDPISFEGPCKSTNIHFQVYKSFNSL